MSEYQSMARVLLHEAEEAVERDAVRAAAKGSTADPWTPEQLLGMALVNAVLAVADGGASTAGGGSGQRYGHARTGVPRRLRTQRPINQGTYQQEGAL